MGIDSNSSKELLAIDSYWEREPVFCNNLAPAQPDSSEEHSFKNIWSVEIGLAK